MLDLNMQGRKRCSQCRHFHGEEEYKSIRGFPTVACSQCRRKWAKGSARAIAKHGVMWRSGQKIRQEKVEESV